MIGLLLLLLLGGQATDWTSTRNNATDVLNGSFTSCPDGDDGQYGEQVYLWRQRSIAIAEIHLGPRQSFAVFADEVAGERDHAGADNLLGPAREYDDVRTVAGGRNWSIASLHLHVNVVRVPGSFAECYSFFVVVAPMPYTAAAR